MKGETSLPILQKYKAFKKVWCTGLCVYFSARVLPSHIWGPEFNPQRGTYGQMYSDKLNDINETGKLLETHNTPRLNNDKNSSSE
jgi:hypothetical protein